jgi:DnaJ like chaperone protein
MIPFLIVLALVFIFYLNQDTGSSNNGHVLPTTSQAILGIISVVMRADNAITKAELATVKPYLLRNFGENNAKQLLLELKEILQNGEIRDFRPHCVRINRDLAYSQKLELLTLLFYIAKANNGVATNEEIAIIYQYARNTAIQQQDLMHLSQTILGGDYNYRSNYDNNHRRGYGQNSNTQTDLLEKAYQILGVSSSVSDAELKHAFRQMAKKWHPDKFAGHSEAEIKDATVMFRKANNAYNYICKRRGI